MITKFKSKLSQRQKSQIKFCLALISFLHVKSFVNISRYEFTSRDLFNKLHPVATNLKLVRLGGTLDGSYLVPKIDVKYDGLISPGVGQTFEFEKATANSLCRVVLIDGTVDKPQDLPSDFIFIRKMLGSSTKSDLNQISMKEVISNYFPTSQSLLV